MARLLNFNDGANNAYDFLAPVAQQGNGVVDALRAVKTKTALSSPYLAWNDTTFFTRSASFQASEEFLQNLIADRHANITIPPLVLRIRPGETATVRVIADIKTLDDLRPCCPLYSGFIHVSDGRIDARAAGQPGLTVSYMGIGCLMRQMAVMPSDWNRTFVTAAMTKLAEGKQYNAVPISPNATFLL
ncbi:hypothetical protein CTA1_11868 [Colletotrichum tanaceti]|uniref:Uncharacterized protein n=1 Tax=Colletotrichum tanaceti TaxID=1306861 RepID=A0A4U6XHF1_9PEZI|nr:hypothetical protein CTA1_11868 [Colletotrichum tanaceti]